MAMNESFVEFVKEQMSGLDGISYRKMFGGMGIFHEGKIFAIIAYSELYLKVNESTKGDFTELGMEQFKPFDHKPMKMSYYQIPPDVLESKDEFEEWAVKAIRISK